MIFSLLTKRRSLEEMLAALASCGIKLREGMSIDRAFGQNTKIISEISRATLEKEGFEGVLAVVGEELLDKTTYKSLGPLSDDVWHFDSECIEDHGDYKLIAENLCRLTKGDLTFDRIEDFVDVEEETAWIELTKSGQTEHLDLKVRNDWVDPAVFALLQRRLVETDAPKRFAVRGLGQDAVVVCQTPEGLETLQQATGLRFFTDLVRVVG